MSLVFSLAGFFKTRLNPADLDMQEYEGYEVEVTGPDALPDGSAEWYEVTVSYPGRFGGTKEATLKYLRRVDS